MFHHQLMVNKHGLFHLTECFTVEYYLKAGLSKDLRNVFMEKFSNDKVLTVSISLQNKIAQ